MPKVLVVDDDESLRMLYSKELTEEGYEVQTVPSGQDALESIKQSRPDAVILDIKMEGMDGLSVLDRIMEHDKTIPVVGFLHMECGCLPGEVQRPQRAQADSEAGPRRFIGFA
jgi:CheY-like chemotaxis protein